MTGPHAVMAGMLIGNLLAAIVAMAFTHNRFGSVIRSRFSPLHQRGIWAFHIAIIVQPLVEAAVLAWGHWWW
jgi:hypothetical protein